MTTSTGPASFEHLPAIRFGECSLDRNSRELWIRGQCVRLQEKPFLVLSLLLERAGAVVTREELRQTLWPASVYIDFDHGLNNAITRLRETLGDAAATPRFIETLPRLGYRFIHPTTSMSSEFAMQHDTPGGVPSYSWLAGEFLRELAQSRRCRFTVAQIMQIIGESRIIGAAAAARKHGLSAHTLYVWRRKFAALEARQLKEFTRLQLENAWLRKLLADQDVALDFARQALSGKP